jgi:hypothetical protein
MFLISIFTVTILFGFTTLTSKVRKVKLRGCIMSQAGSKGGGYNKLFQLVPSLSCHCAAVRPGSLPVSGPRSNGWG